jgi:signal transduction histidine kinase/uncharacterized protein HemY
MKKISMLVGMLLFYTGSIIPEPVDSLKQLLKSSTGEKRINFLLELGEHLILTDPQEALTAAAEALELAKQAQLPSLVASSFQLIGKAYYRLKDYSNSKSYLLQAHALFTEQKDTAKIASVYDNLGDTYEKSGGIDSAIIFFDQARELFEKIGNKKEEAMAYSSMGLLYWRRGQNLRALEYHFKAYQLRKELNLELSIAMSANNLGVVYWRLGNYQRALEYYTESLSIRERHNDRKGIIVANNNMGLIYFKLNDLEKALELFESSLRESEQLDYTFGKAYSHHVLGHFYLKTKDYQKSISHSLKAVQFYYEVNELNSVALSMGFLGEAYAGLKDYNKAKEIFNAALDTAEKANDIFSLAAVLQKFAGMYYDQNDLAGARKSLDQCLALAYRENFIDLIIDGELLYSQIEKRGGNFKKALEYYEKYMQTLNYSRLEQLSSNISDWELKYSTQQKEYENILLRQENRIKEAEIAKEKLFRNWLAVLLLITLLSLFGFIRYYTYKRKTAKQIVKQKEELERLNKILEDANVVLEEDIKAKDRLFSIIAHDLRSPFHFLLNYSSILISDIDNLTQQDIVEYSRIINKSSEILLELTQNLLNWSKFQFTNAAINREEINLAEMFNSVIDLHRESAGKKEIKLILNIENDLKLTSDKEMLQAILRNLISNAIKFSHEVGEINFSASLDNGMITILVIDNGIGIDQDRLETIFSLEHIKSTPGTNSEKGTGIGLVICNDFVKRLGGTINIESELGKGTTFMVSLPWTNSD